MRSDKLESAISTEVRPTTGSAAALKRIADARAVSCFYCSSDFCSSRLWLLAAAAAASSINPPLIRSPSSPSSATSDHLSHC